jgi:hypothetical protein
MKYQTKQINDKRINKNKINEEKIKQKIELIEKEKEYFYKENKKIEYYKEALISNRTYLENQIKENKFEEFMSNNERKINKKLLENI